MNVSFVQQRHSPYLAARLPRLDSLRSREAARQKNPARATTNEGVYLSPVGADGVPGEYRALDRFAFTMSFDLATRLHGTAFVVRPGQERGRGASRDSGNGWVALRLLILRSRKTMGGRLPTQAQGGSWPNMPSLSRGRGRLAAIT